MTIWGAGLRVASDTSPKRFSDQGAVRKKSARRLGVTDKLPHKSSLPVGSSSSGPCWGLTHSSLIRNRRAASLMTSGPRPPTVPSVRTISIGGPCQIPTRKGRDGGR